MKSYLLQTFAYNETANKRLLEKISQLPQQEQAIKLFSHLINCQYKWMARVKQDPAAAEMSWWEPLYPLNELKQEWEKSVAIWLEYINNTSEEVLAKEVTFIGFDGAVWAAAPMDIALQLNYHSIHHRAQIQTIIRQQGLEPDFLDYIGTKYRRIG